MNFFVLCYFKIKQVPQSLGGYTFTFVRKRGWTRTFQKPICNTGSRLSRLSRAMPFTFERLRTFYPLFPRLSCYSHLSLW